MTKHNLAKLIINIAQDDFNTEADKLEGIKELLSCLTPKDFEQFSKWGQSNEQSTPDKCWE